MLFIYISKYQNKKLHKSILITVAKTCEKVLTLNMNSRPKVKEENLYLKSHITKQLLKLASETGLSTPVKYFY